MSECSLHESGMLHPEINFFRSNHRVYYVATGEFIQQSNGFRVPFYLCHILNELGFEAYVTAQKQAPNLRTPLLTPEIIKKHKEDRREIIAVYTEAMWGNVLRGDVVVHWILNRIGKLFDEASFPNDLFFYWDTEYSKNENNATFLRIPCVDDKVFYFENELKRNRKGFAYYAHKFFRDFNGVIPREIKENGISLCQDIPRTHGEIADVLRNVEALYCFEDSALMMEAVACGCIVIFVKTEFTSYIRENAKYIDYIVEIEDVNIDRRVGYTGSAYNDFLNEKTKIESSINDFITATQQSEVCKSIIADPMVLFFGKYKTVYIFGTGLTAEVVYNAIRVAGFDINGFIISDGINLGDSKQKFGHPVLSFSSFLKIKTVETGVITAMIGQYYKQVLPFLEKHSINVCNPVIY